MAGEAVPSDDPDFALASLLAVDARIAADIRYGWEVTTVREEVVASASSAWGRSSCMAM